MPIYFSGYSSLGFKHGDLSVSFYMPTNSRTIVVKPVSVGQRVEVVKTKTVVKSAGGYSATATIRRSTADPNAKNAIRNTDVIRY